MANDNNAPAEDDDPPVATVNAQPAPGVANADELRKKIAAAGGALLVPAYSSAWLVAINNSLQFTAERQADGRFLIKARNLQPFIVGGAVLLFALVLLSD